jgi:ATP-dependent helicase/nuclease subunit B
VLAVREAVEAGQVPVALVAEDRLVVRRARALLERAGVALADETGWTLSTTRAAAGLMACLRAVLPSAGRDALVEAMKAAGPEYAEASAALEDAWRRERAPGAEALAGQQAFTARLSGLRLPGTPSLMVWLDTLDKALPELIAGLAGDAAGRQVLGALRLGRDRRREPSSWVRAAQGTPLDLAGFLDWVDRTLECSSFVPASPAGAQVVITPLALAAGRPFPAVVFPSCDERHLGAFSAAPGLVPDAVAQQLGLPTASARQREREALAFAAVLRTPAVVLVRRSHDGAEALAPSPWVELMRMARRRAGLDDPDEQDLTLPQGRIARQPVQRPAPVFGDRLPVRLSATAVEALRECPYQFFVREALGLRETGELDDEADHGDYGRWLHATLHGFHTQRSRTDDRAELLAAADAAQEALALDAAQMWPFRAAFGDFATRYLAWLHARDEQGWQFQAGEVGRRTSPAALGGVIVDGRLDRIDQGPDGRLMVIDYKTGRADKLKQRVKHRLEDTQLAFYAALVAGDDGAPPRAVYLPLRDKDALVPIEHEDVAETARRLIDGLGADLAALRAGAGAAALGEPPACDHCAARGLCRRDHWSGA